VSGKTELGKHGQEQTQLVGWTSSDPAGEGDLLTQTNDRL